MFSEYSTQNYFNAWCSTTPVYSGKWGECLCQTDQSYFNGDITDKVLLMIYSAVKQQ
jgi:hypothetical protein